jgi:DNA-binding response OmpR family regulator
MMPTVLIAEADAELCELYRRFFSHHSWQVQISGGGLECLAKLRQSSPRILILDVHLPWGGADGLLALMRDDPRLACVPVILTSTDALSGPVSPQVVHTLWKPFPLTALLEIVRSELGKGQPTPRKESREWTSAGVCS